MSHLKYKKDGSWIDYATDIYPVGSVYLTYNTTSPATLFGGTWTRVGDSLDEGGLIGFYCESSKNDGGYDNIGTMAGWTQISLSHMPSHQHKITLTKDAFGVSGASNYVLMDTTQRNPLTSTGQYTSSVGSSQNFYPRHVTVYMWRRTA